MALKDRYFSISQAADKLGVTRQSVHRWVTTGEISSEKVGRETLIKKTEIKRYMDERRMRRTANRIMLGIADHIRAKYKYTNSDKVEFLSFDRRRANFRFSVVKKDKTRETVSVNVGAPKPIGNKNKSNLYFGFKIPIKKIERRKATRQV